MALRFLTTVPFFAPPTDPSSSSSSSHISTEIHFSRWNNANSAHLEARRRAQEQIERDIRLTRRFQSADNIASTTTTTSTSTNPSTHSSSFRSSGTPSTPSKPSIPGRKSKYSKPPKFHTIPPQSAGESLNTSDKTLTTIDRNNVVVTEDGVSYKVEGVPFEFMYSYTETPKVKPIGLREVTVQVKYL